MFIEDPINDTILLNNKLSTREFIILSVYIYSAIYSLKISSLLDLNDKIIIVLTLLPIIVACLGIILMITMIDNKNKKSKIIDQILTEYIYCTIFGNIQIIVYEKIKMINILITMIIYTLVNIVVVILSNDDNVLYIFSITTMITLIIVLGVTILLGLMIFKTSKTHENSRKKFIKDLNLIIDKKYTLIGSLKKNFLKKVNYEYWITLMLINVITIINVATYNNNDHLEILSILIIIFSLFKTLIYIYKVYDYNNNNGNESTIANHYRKILHKELTNEGFFTSSIFFFSIALFIISLNVLSDNLNIILLLPSYISALIYIIF